MHDPTALPDLLDPIIRTEVINALKRLQSIHAKSVLNQLKQALVENKVAVPELIVGLLHRASCIECCMKAFLQTDPAQTIDLVRGNDLLVVNALLTYLETK